ncbi:MAG: hypothetical protein EOO46_16035 [Flavobacterium sp.]|nr:MAG: hypothetical protein EOO46_16035 [Flavobacterium sp.]
MENEKPKDNKSELLGKFLLLKSFKRKLTFWTEELKVNYLDYLEEPNSESHIDLYPFRIGQEEGKERKELNDWLLDSIPKVFQYYKFLSLQSLKRSLTKQLVVSKDKRKTLIDEKRKIDNSFQGLENRGGIFQRGRTIINSEYSADYISFKHSYDDNEEPDYSKVYPSIQINQVHNGYILGQYKRYIVDEIDKIDSSKEKKTELDIEQIALLLDKVGALEGMKCDITDKARIFSGLLGVNYKDLYDAMREVKGKQISKNKSNLKEILVFLEENEVKAYKKEIKDAYDELP